MKKSSLKFPLRFTKLLSGDRNECLRFLSLPSPAQSSISQTKYVLLKPIFVYSVFRHRLPRHALPSGLPSSARPYPKERSQQYLRPSLYELLSWKLGGKGPPSDLQPSSRLVRSAHIFGRCPANSYGKGYFYLNFLQSSSSTPRAGLSSEKRFLGTKLLQERVDTRDVGHHFMLIQTRPLSGS